MEDNPTEEQELKARQQAAIAAQTKGSSGYDGQDDQSDASASQQNETPTQGDSKPTAPSAIGAEDQNAQAQGGAQSAPSAQEGQEGDASTTPDPNQQQAAGQAEKMIPQSQVDKLVGKARQEGRDSAMKALYDKYGIETPESLDELFGNGQRYDGLNDQFSQQGETLRELQSENALLKSKIDPNRYDDVKAYLSYNKLDVTPENITQGLASHPEWMGNAVQGNAPAAQPQPLTPEMGQQAVQNSQLNAQNKPSPTPSVVTRLGAEPGAKSPETDEETKAMHLYGLDK